jgi:hypothetical protein
LSSLPPDDDITFRPTDEVNFFLRVLRDSELGWIADEVELNIREGKTAPKEIMEMGARGRRRTTESATSPYDPEEQLGILIHTIRHYFVEPPKLWAEVQLQLPRLANSPNLTLSVVRPDSEQPETLFPDNLPGDQSTLDALLAQAWPYGVESYEHDEERELK